jgi:CubicO group peptidase (beta-lactamase class C family)
MKREVTAPEDVGMSSALLERIKPKIQEYVADGRYSGISTMLARRGRVVHSCQVGWAEVESRRPLSPDTIFRIYSMTKPIVCTALMTLYEEGRFQLNDPIAKYLPAFGTLKVLRGDSAGTRSEVDPGRPPTVRDLLTHTAGFTYDFMASTPVAEMYREARICNDAQRTLEEMVKELARLPLAFQPGTRWHYSVSIDVAAHLVEVLSGVTLGEGLERRIFGPLGMADTGFAVPAAKLDRVATMYGCSFDLFGRDATLVSLSEETAKGQSHRMNVSETNPADRGHRFARGGHGLFSTAWDYMRFAQMLLNKGHLDGQRILGRKTCELMHVNHLAPDLLPYDLEGQPWSGYGFGLGSRVLLDVAESQLPGSLGEFGWAGAAKTYYWVDPREEMVGVLMAQCMGSLYDPRNDFQVLAYQAVAD